MSTHRTTRLARSIFFARYEATQWASAEVAPEHLLLGLLREGKRLAPVLRDGDLSADAVRSALTARMPRGQGDPGPMPDLPLTVGAQAALSRADDEARRAGATQTDVGHLLIGLLGDPSSLPFAVLSERGLTVAGARAVLDQSVADEPGPGAPGTAQIMPARNPRAISGDRGLHHWRLDGHTLLDLLSKIHHVSFAHIVLPDGLNAEVRFDASATAPIGLDPPDSWQAMEQLLAEALTTQFGITTRWETRSVDTHVLTAPEGIQAPLESPEGGGGLMALSLEVADETGPDDEEPGAHRDHAAPALDALSGLSGSTSMAGLCYCLEQVVRHPVFDETGTEGAYRLQVTADPAGRRPFPDLLREATGLVLAAERREVELLVVFRQNG